MKKPNIVIEESGWGELFQMIPDTVLSIMQLNNQLNTANNQMIWQSQEKQLDRQFARETANLDIQARRFDNLMAQKIDFEKELVSKGYSLPEYNKTTPGTTLMEDSLKFYQQSIPIEEQNLQILTDELAKIAEAKDYASNQADMYGDLVKADKDEAWKNYLLEGGLDTDPQTGEITGTGEMALWLKKQSPEMLEKLKDKNYRRSLLSSLRTVEEAKNLEMVDRQIEAQQTSIDGARLAMSKNQYELAIAQLNEYEKNIAGVYRQASLSTKSNFNYISDGVSYKLSDLDKIGASDVSDLIDIKQEFLEDPLNAPIYAEAEAFISGVETARGMGMDDSEFVAKFAKAAYDDFMLLKEYEAELTLEGGTQDMTLAEMYKSLPKNDATKLEMKRLRAKVEGYKRLGLYRAGGESLDRMSAIVLQHNEQQSMRLGLDMDDAHRIASQGLNLTPLEELYPSEQEYMTPKMKRDLDISLAALEASKIPEDAGSAGSGGAKTLGEKAMQIPAIRLAGWTADKANQFLYNMGVDIYNMAAFPINNLTYLLTGYNPGIKGSEFMDRAFGWTGASSEGMFAPELEGGGTLFGTPRGKFSWDEIDESLNNIED